MENQPQNSIGHKDNLSEAELAGKHVCGVTGWVFDSEEDYIAFIHPEPVEEDPE